jgi:hypothetical protein
MYYKIPKGLSYIEEQKLFKRMRTNMQQNTPINALSAPNLWRETDWTIDVEYHGNIGKDYNISTITSIIIYNTAVTWNYLICQRS